MLAADEIFSNKKILIVSDASSKSFPIGKELDKAISAGCLGNHGRFKFPELKDNYPKECSYFLNLT